MSNALARKKKRMQPLGYSKSELIGIQRHAKAQSNADYLIEESYYNVRMMACITIIVLFVTRREI